MIRRFLILILVAFLVLLKFPLNRAFAHEGQHHPTPNTEVPGEFGKEFAAFAKAMEAGMEKMMINMHRLGMTGTPDVDFLAMMIPHHEGAVEMARLVLIYGEDPLVRQLAEEIIASQQVEIAAMQTRLPILKKGADLDPEGFPAVHGVRGTASSTSQNI